MISIADYREKLFDILLLMSSWEYRDLAQVAAHPMPLRAAQHVRSTEQVPRFDNSQMDGFVVHPNDPEVVAGKPIPLLPMVAAGHNPEPLKPGFAMPIMTGAKIPAWAGPTVGECAEDGVDLCVVPVEETVAGFDDLSHVTFTPQATFEPGRFVRYRGSDIDFEEKLCAVGDHLTPALLGSLASVGLTQIAVFKPLRVLVVSTGDEVCQPGQHPGVAQIYDSNTSAAVAALSAAGAHVVGTLHAPDHPDLLLDAVRSWQADDDRRADVVVSMGGISMGAREVIRLASELEVQRGVENWYGGAQSPRLPNSGMEFCRLPMQPGGPQAVGQLAGVPWVALPGNPVSTLVSIEVLLRTSLFGARPRNRMSVTVRTPGGEPVSSPAGKTQMRFARTGTDGSALLECSNSSHLLHMQADATLLVIIPEDVTVIEDGDTFEALAL